MKVISLATRVSIAYIVFGVLWVLFADKVFTFLAGDSALLVQGKAYGGWLFVAMSAILIYLWHAAGQKQQNQIEIQLRENEERYRLLFETSLDAILLTAPDGQILAANPAACRIFGRSEAELQQVGRAGVIDLSDPRLPVALEIRARTGSFSGELRFVRADGSTFPGEIYTKVFTNQIGQARTSMSIRDISQWKNAEAALITAAQEWRATFDAAADMICLLDCDLNILRANRAMTSFFNIQPAELVGRSCRELIYGTNKLITQCPALRVIHTHAREEYSGLIIRDSVFDVTADPLFDEHGNLLGAVHIMRDITVRKKVQEDLRLSEERFKAIAANTPDHILIQDQDLRYRLVINPQLGLTENEMLGKTDYDFLSIDEADRLTAVKKNVLLNGTAAHFSTSLFAVDGKEEFFDGTYVPSYDENGRPSGLIGYFKNVTEQKQAEAALRKSEERFRSLVEQAPTAILIQLDGKITYVNRAGLKLFGANTENDLVGRLIVDQFSTALQNQILNQSTGAQKYSVARSEDTLLTLNGTRIIVDTSSVPFGAGTLIFLHDITALKRVEAALEESFYRLRSVTSRLVALEETERRNFAKELHDRVGQSLTVLSINLGLIRNKAAKNKTVDFIPQIETGLELVTDITDSIRTIMSELHPPVLDDYGLMAALRWYAERIQHQAGIKISVVGNMEHARLTSATSLALFRIAQEALTNVIKHAKTDKAKITLKETRNTFQMIIEDAGVGFEQPTQPLNSQVAHWGLATMRERAESINGFLKIESSISKGTKISVILPQD